MALLPLDERNRNLLIAALRENGPALRMGAFTHPGALLAMRWHVPSKSSPGSVHTVEDVLYWDSRRELACDCPWSSPGPQDTRPRLPGELCRHRLLVLFSALALADRAALFAADLGIRRAFIEGMNRARAEREESVEI